MKYYMYASPSLEGILTHDMLSYEGVNRPAGILRAFDRPGHEDNLPVSGADNEILEQYLSDLYSVFMKKLSAYVVGADHDDMEAVKLQAMLQEIIKIKKIRQTTGNL